MAFRGRDLHRRTPRKKSRVKKVNPSTARLLKSMGVDAPSERTPRPKRPKATANGNGRRSGNIARVERGVEKALEKKPR